MTAISINMLTNSKKYRNMNVTNDVRGFNFRGHIYDRKAIMAPFFSESAFGSQSDTKREFFDPWEDEILMRKHRIRLLLDRQGGDYDEDRVAIMNPENINCYDIKKE